MSLVSTSLPVLINTISFYSYSSGAVYVWTLTSEEGPVTLETGHTHPATPISCRISQGWAAVATQQGTLYTLCINC